MRPEIRRAITGIVVLAVGAAAFAWGFQLATWQVTADHVEALSEAAQGELPLLDPEEMRRLQALGYGEGSLDPDAHLRGVIEHDAASAHPGLNLYNSWLQKGALLLDMQGEVVHEWSTPETTWAHVDLLADCGLLAIAKDRAIHRYRKDSELVWTVEGGFHHDFFIAEDRIWALARENLLEPTVHAEVDIRAEKLVEISLDGEILAEHSMLDFLSNSPYRYLIPNVSFRKLPKSKPLDIFHANHVEVFDGSQVDASPLLAEGNILLSLRNIDTIMIVDPSSWQTIWAWGPSTLTHQHHPSLVPNGNIMVFNNGLADASEVIEVDPETLEVEWSYAPGPTFYSQNMGSAQRLANGNTLITASRKGYAFEVTRAGEVVWRFANPDVNEEGIRASIWRMKRFEMDDPRCPAAP